MGKGREDVQMITIDSLRLEGCDFIKIDVEGAEPLVFLGGERTITKFFPIIFFEKNFKTLTQDIAGICDILSQSIPDSVQILKNYGYNSFERIGDDILAIKN